MYAKFKETKFYQGCVKLLNDLKPMTFQQRVEHLWMYYKEYLWCAGVVLVALSLAVTVIINQTKDTVVSGIMANISIDQEGYNYLSEDYHQRLNGGDKKKIVELDYIYFGDMEDLNNGYNSYYSAMTLTARVSGGQLDYMILDQFALEYYIGQEVYMDLREFFTEQELAQLEAQERVIYAMQEGDTERWPIAVDITQIPFARDNIDSEGKVFFALSGNTQRPEMCRDAWEYIHAWKEKD